MPLILNLSRISSKVTISPVPYHLFTLSPLDEPWAYAAFCLQWLSSLVCVFVSVQFFRKQKGAWWLIIALAFALPLIGQTFFGLFHGLPPLPYGTIYPDQHGAPASPGYSNNTTTGVTVNIYWDTLSPLIALALGWAYLADKKNPAGNSSTAQT